MTTNEAAERLNAILAANPVTHEQRRLLVDALAAERRNAGQCDGYAGDAGASAPRCESYAGHPGRHFIRFDGKAHEDMVRRATVERMLAHYGLPGTEDSIADVYRTMGLDEEAAR